MTLSKKAVSDNNWEYSLSFIFDSTYNGIIAVDKNGYLVVFNNAAKKMFNLNDDVIGMHFQEIIPESRLPLMSLLRKGKPEPGLKVTINDRACLANLTPIKKEGEVVGGVAVFEDITVIQGVVKDFTSVKETRGILEVVLDNAREGIVVTDREGCIEMCNMAFCEFLKVTGDALTGKEISSVLPEMNLHSVLKTGQTELSDLKQIRGSDVIISRIPVFSDGEVDGAIGKIIFKYMYEKDSLLQRISVLKNKLGYYQEQLEKMSGARYNVDNIVGKSQVITQLKETVKEVAPGSSTILFRGDTGSGKELFAHALHRESPRKYGPFVKADCSAIPEKLLETELFGFAEGAVPRSHNYSRIGKIEMADQGTVFIDEIGDISLSIQAGLLKVLQEKAVWRIGDQRMRPVDVRVVAATRRNLEDLVRQKVFREDLYYRLNVLSFYIPPLKEREEDIEPLIAHMIEKFNNEYGKKVIGPSSEAYSLLVKHTWPGNVRELEHVMERIFSVIDDRIIQTHHLPVYLKKITGPQMKKNDRISLKTIIEDTERNAIIQALQRTGGNKVKAAKLLDISRAGLYQKLEKHHLLDD